MPYISFSCLITLARTSNTMLKSNGEREHPCLAPDLHEKVPSASILVEHYLPLKSPTCPSMKGPAQPNQWEWPKGKLILSFEVSTTGNKERSLPQALDVPHHGITDGGNLEPTQGNQGTRVHSYLVALKAQSHQNIIFQHQYTLQLVIDLVIDLCRMTYRSFLEQTGRTSLKYNPFLLDTTWYLLSMKLPTRTNPEGNSIEKIQSKSAWRKTHSSLSWAEKPVETVLSQ